MKKILMAVFSTLALTLFAAQDMIVLFDSNVATSSTANAVSSTALYGRIDRLYINAEVSTNDYDVTVEITATDQYSSESRTLVTAGVLGMGTNLSTSPRVTLVDTTGSAITDSHDKFNLYNDVLTLNVYSASKTNRDVRAYIYLDR